jgi:transcriptional regulator with XRE-family HTH domain
MTYEEYCKLRDSRGLTDYAVANQANVSRSSLSQWKNGASKPSKRTIMLLQNFFNDHKELEVFKPDKAIAFPERPIFGSITGYVVDLGKGLSVEITPQEYKELSEAIDIFIKTWVRARKKITAVGSPDPNA